MSERTQTCRRRGVVPGGSTADLALAELLLRFWTHAEEHYRLLDGSPSRELDHY